MVSWRYSSYPVLLEIGTSFQQPELFHGGFSALLEMGTSFQQAEWFHGGSSALLEIGTHSSNQNGFIALFQLRFR
jgi:hypothetical protein